ncbi:nucleoside triphosphate hydrolase protein [Wolfiporia cocos MD-104 SS10]|uniref:Nucleoside triphosphate hydrolase protein n=1 Tax=Wolfiporia cocos (strain MD-104) TaxID=742152 RepID=A0A2H3J8Z5_WOLCO|nr:nucleoside triphosphate hydrolase protein [Wolfiporia cocos MD-104 SS10]
MTPSRAGQQMPKNIVIMGPTGSGKTSFINIASGSRLRVGKGLRSTTGCTQTSRTFRVDGCPVRLIDTPGFDDSNMSDVEILTKITKILSSKKMVVHGIIYLHRITDNRMSGTARRSFDTFRYLCGEALPNAAVVLNMWDMVSDPVRIAREEELRTKFYKPAFDAGAQLFRHVNTVESAHRVLQALASQDPLPLRIQTEIAIEGKQLWQTTVGMSLLQHMAEKEQRRLDAARDSEFRDEKLIHQETDYGEGYQDVECWMICLTKFVQEHSRAERLSGSSMQRLWVQLIKRLQELLICLINGSRNCVP